MSLDNTKTLAENIKNMCKERGERFSCICEDLGINYESVRSNFTRYQPKALIMIKLAKYFDVDAEEFAKLRIR